VVFAIVVHTQNAFKLLAAVSLFFIMVGVLSLPYW